MSHIQYDSHGTRYTLYKHDESSEQDWVFIPGGPGIDSRYMTLLIDALDLPGKVWLIDLPNNGDNIQSDDLSAYDYEKWAEAFIAMMHEFNKPVLVTHSFSGLYTLLFPELEKLVSGYVIFDSAPCFWVDAAEEMAKQFGLEPLSKGVEIFEKNPTIETFGQVFLSRMPYYFPPESIERGEKLLNSLPINFHATSWWFAKATQLDYSKLWVPQKVPTLIVGASHDIITPITLFQHDERYQRDNIEIVKIENAGHFPWMEQPKAVYQTFEQFKTKRASL